MMVKIVVLVPMARAVVRTITGAKKRSPRHGPNGVLEVLHTGSEAPDRSSFHAGANRVPAGDPYIVISNDFWRNHFGGDPGLVGRELVLNGHSYTVIGVAPAGFRGTNVLNGPDVWLPMMMHEQLFTSMPQMMFGMRRALQFDSL